jgi:hypothetical protein
MQSGGIGTRGWRQVACGDVAEIVLASAPLNLVGSERMDELRATVDGVAADRPRALLI